MKGLTITDMSQRAKTACVAFSLGCPRSEAETARLVEYLKANGWRMTRKLREADVVLLATCGFSAANEQTSMQFVAAAAARKRPEARLIVFGCLSGINPAGLREHGDAVPVPPIDVDRLDELLGAEVKLADVKAPNVVSSYVEECSRCFGPADRLAVRLKLWREICSRAWLRGRVGSGPNLPQTRYGRMFEITIATGCSGRCTYCAIRFATGPTRSNPLKDVVAEFRQGLEEGHKVLRLNAGDVGAYGQDNGDSIVVLLERLFSLDGEFKLLFDDFSPRWLVRYFPELLDILSANVARVGYAGFPIQSGSERILRLMERDYTAADAGRCLLALREGLPALEVVTHVLIGFPGETERDFQDTVEFVRRVGFKHIQAYAYSDRPRTAAADLPDKVPERVKRSRQARFRREFRQTCQVI